MANTLKGSSAMAKADNKRISIVIPAYNEERVISSVLKTIPAEIKIKSEIYDISVIVVNDGSSDGTAEIVNKHESVHLVNHLLNSGAGAATRTGLSYSKHLNSTYVITMDADGQHAVEDVIKVAKEICIGASDLVIGSRLIETKGMPWYRILGNKGLSFITFLVFGVFVKDSQSGLRAYNQNALNKITFHSNHYAFCSEMIWSAHRQNLIIKEVPITAIYSEYSLAKGQSNWGAIQIIRQIIKRKFLHLFHG